MSGTRARRDSVRDIEFIDPGELVDGDLRLELSATSPADHANGFLPVYRFSMLHGASHEELGSINLRVGQTAHVQMFRGHIGYRVLPRHRGQRLAAPSCQLLRPLIRHHRIAPIWLTCTDGNLASQRTLERLGALYVGTLEVPEHHAYIEYYPLSERRKRRYRWDV